MALSDLIEFNPGFFVPKYAPMQRGQWVLRLTQNILCQGYWGPAVLVPSMAALIRDGDVWMSITPMELESQSIGIELAYGHVVIFGLGMGWAASATALRPQVSDVTIVEFDSEVIALHEEMDIFGQLPQEIQAKIRIEQGDAHSWRPSKSVDLLMPDIWLPLVSDGRIAEVQAMQANVRAHSIYFWGQELEIARHAKAAGRNIDDVGIAATISDFALPLVGPETQEYTARVTAVAQRWMRDRWLP
ncbi:hypothetical protein [Sphingorhabdus sp.]|jgi:hypothetical protein|uniref:hypothetical protein n=1 Tax=Sphingorhabdus sp. TaxID=1902408 RepID=UPI003BB0FF73|nr:hypothetical protein [Sphingomonadales bacterium]MBL0022243.1 hypothetical protein [Sphingomonadales bacterium]